LLGSGVDRPARHVQEGYQVCLVPSLSQSMLAAELLQLRDLEPLQSREVRDLRGGVTSGPFAAIPCPLILGSQKAIPAARKRRNEYVGISSEFEEYAEPPNL